MVYGRTVCSLSVKYPWLIWLAGWYMQGGSAGSQYIKSGAEELYVNIGETNWWDARAACKENDWELMSSDDLPEQLVTRLDSSTSYWIGAVKYFSWTWLADKTPFYTYAGYSGLPTVQPLGSPVRSVYSCHYHCTKHHTVFGLSVCTHF
ncbi:uncharacterized protein LOC125384246 [Haliotis rufescens]|uniref:uncharacterized protein LOC125384246 n=1 Tax=Haliotis rufescens TaxID=6454 RepID=UPI00201F6A37|nr:uncharacterized protein LOC125384246 [Haliotis rufescens]